MFITPHREKHDLLFIETKILIVQVTTWLNTTIALMMNRADKEN